MKFLAIFLVLSQAAPAFAEDAPWFGSEASPAEQISLTKDEKPLSAEIVLNSKPKCLPETCSVTDKLAK
jgi:hypothetical protein